MYVSVCLCRFLQYVSADSCRFPYVPVCFSFSERNSTGKLQTDSLRVPGIFPLSADVSAKTQEKTHLCHTTLIS